MEPPDLADGGPRTNPEEPVSVRQKALADEIMRDDREVLRKLAE